MKIRYLLSIAIASIFLILTHQLWLIYKPLNVSFNLEGTGNINITVIGDKKNSDFQRYKKADTKVNLSKNKPQKITLDIEKLRKLKAVRLFIDVEDKNTDNIFILEPLNFAHEKYKLDDLSKYKSDNSVLTIEGNKLKIAPKAYPVKIIYDGNYPGIKTEKNIDYCLVIIVFIVSYLFSLKLLSYLYDFKNIKNQSRIEVIFLALFFLILFIPVSNIDRDDISIKEQRRLAQYKPLITQDGLINYKFGEDFNNWFNDRFFMRDFLISFGEAKKFLNINWETTNILKGQDGWLFFKGDSGVRNFQNLDLYSDDDLKTVADYLSAINKYCKSKNIKFIFVICPDKNKIYGDKYPLSIKKIREDDKSRANQLITYLKQNTDIDCIYLYDVLIKKKDEGLYYKTDSHWNGLGGYLGYIELFNRFKNGYPNLIKAEIIKGEKENYSGDLNIMLPDFFKQQEDMNYNPKIINPSFNCKLAEYDDKIQICNNPKGSYNLVTYNDSFMGAMMNYMAQSFKSAVFNAKRLVIKKDIENADVVIFEIVERQLPVLTNKKLLEDYNAL